MNAGASELTDTLVGFVQWSCVHVRRMTEGTNLAWGNKHLFNQSKWHAEWCLRSSSEMRQTSPPITHVKLDQPCMKGSALAEWSSHGGQPCQVLSGYVTIHHRWSGTCPWPWRIRGDRMSLPSEPTRSFPFNAKYSNKCPIDFLDLHDVVGQRLHYYTSGFTFGKV